jgi:hypothetical protein
VEKIPIGSLNESALIAVAVFAVALLSIFGTVYHSASESQRRGELNAEGIRILRWALLGHLTLFVILALTALFT